MTVKLSESVNKSFVDMKLSKSLNIMCDLTKMDNNDFLVNLL